MQRSHSSNWLVNGGSPKERFRYYRLVASELLDSVTSGPVDLKVIDYGDADSGHVMVFYPICDRLREEQSVFNSADSLLKDSAGDATG